MSLDTACTIVLALAVTAVAAAGWLLDLRHSTVDRLLAEANRRRSDTRLVVDRHRGHVVLTEYGEIGGMTWAETLAAGDEYEIADALAALNAARRFPPVTG